MKFILKPFLLLFFFGFYIIPSSVFSAHIILDIPDKNIVKDQEFLVRISIDTEGQQVNTIGGNIIYPKDILEIKEIRDGNSIVNFWLDYPKIDAPGSSLFSGVIPGGYQGENGFVFSVVFKAKNNGKGVISINSPNVLLNDGNATKINPKINSINFSISDNNGVVPPTIFFMKETSTPETFKAEVGQSDDVLGGKYFLAFATQDKGSGIDHYEVKEGFLGSYNKTDSPYVLENQGLDKKIYVKAVDKDGNEKVEVIYPKNYHPWYENYFVLVVFILLFGYFIKYIDDRIKLKSKNNK